MSSALLLGGGAPTLTLQSGALAALDEKGVEFAAISTAGAGMVIGLLYAAPKGMTRQEALENTVNMGVADEIYNAFPVNYKVFFKPGDMADLYRNFLAMLPQPPVARTPAERLFGDWMALVCSHAVAVQPELRQPRSVRPRALDRSRRRFREAAAVRGEFYINAYNVTDHKMEIFSKDQITPDHFRAALAFPFIYPPYEMNGKYYVEGSAIDTLCFKGLLNYRKRLQVEAVSRRAGGRSRPALAPLKNLVVFDILSSDKIIRTPRTLYEAWIQSIMIPLVEIAKDDIELFDLKYRKNWNVELLQNPVRHSRRSLALCAGLVV